MKPKSELSGNRISAAGSSQACVSTLWGLCLVFCILLCVCVFVSLPVSDPAPSHFSLSKPRNPTCLGEKEDLTDSAGVGHLPRWPLAPRVHLCNLEKASFLQADAAHPPLSLYRTQPTQQCMPCPLLVHSAVPGMWAGRITWSPQACVWGDAPHQEQKQL